MASELDFLQNWYKAQCDGDWEHSYGITIESLDNPGWMIKIDLEDTNYEDLSVKEFNETSDTDWYSITTSDKVLYVSGDPNKLAFLIDKLKVLLQ